MISMSLCFNDDFFSTDFTKTIKYFFDPNAKKILSQMNGDKLIQHAIVSAIKERHQELQVKKVTATRFFCIFSFVFLVNPS